MAFEALHGLVPFCLPNLLCSAPSSTLPLCYTYEYLIALVRISASVTLFLCFLAYIVFLSPSYLLSKSSTFFGTYLNPISSLSLL
jgi:hypothetical protein